MSLPDQGKTKDEAIAEGMRCMQHFPFRIHGIYSNDKGEWFSFNANTRRKQNDLVRAGYTVFLFTKKDIP